METPSTRPVELVDCRTAKILFTILVFVAFICILYIARAVLILFAFAILLANLINPVVRFLQRHSLFFKNLRGPHVAEAYLTFLILAVFLIHAFVTDLHRHPTRVIGNVQALIERVSSGEIVSDLANNFGWSETQTVRAKSFFEQHKSEIDGFRKKTEQFLSVALGGLVVIPILALFFLSDGEKLAEQVIRLISAPGNHEAIKILGCGIGRDAAALHQSKSNPRSAFDDLYLGRHAPVGLSECNHARCRGWSARIHSRCRLDSRGLHHSHSRFYDSCPLDLDAPTPYSLEDAHGLRNRA
jgi:hypothetical protein